MIKLIEEHLSQIAQVSRKHSVKRLELFGSAASGSFDGSTSDLDFLVEFLSYDTPAIADQWFGLQEDLAKLLGHRVDLTSLRMARNPYFLEVANRQRVNLYAA